MIKRTATLFTIALFSISFLWACAANQSNAEENEPAGTPEGKPMSMVIYNNARNPIIKYDFTYNEAGHLIEEAIWDSSTSGVSNTRKVYELEDTLVQKLTYYGPGDEVLSETKYFYNDKNLRVREETYDTSLASSINYTYNKAGKITEQEYFDRNYGNYKINFSYEDTLMTEAIRYTAQGTVMQHNKFLYNDKGQQTDVFFISAQGDTLSHWRYDYDEDGNKVSTKEMGPGGTNYVLQRFVYDEDGNKLLEEGLRNQKYKIDYLYNNEGKLQVEKHYDEHGMLEREVYY